MPQIPDESPHAANRREGPCVDGPGWQGESSRRRFDRCSHVFGLLVRFT